ncbi:hypothetical protein EVA_06147 [gut metagenome]|uniref:Uncharacterized protein n=1 Tax=gut metagenome TaxID=749906 RepID=J9GEI6_9ZZZZ
MLTTVLHFRSSRIPLLRFLTFRNFADRRSALRSYSRALCFILGIIRMSIVQTLLLSRRSSRIIRSAPNHTFFSHKPQYLVAAFFLIGNDYLLSVPTDAH